ncbi:YciI family protein [Breoghania sp. L-A4]|uniref:YciI family protein n=1 Tax=Breoghania sp. L-A4 TaxID=2304600 RepID=UPI000E35C530|nr:YciI family protein [Breoghania sp. L-A4]AXS42244.1 hypothetical protein D1F64_22445 [Breoghania sp. L-A4]
MLYALICNDNPNSVAARTENRPAHLEHLKGLGDTLKFAGPFLDDNGDPCGSLLVVEADNKKAAVAIGNADPYAKAGIFASVEARGWKWTVNNPEA